VRGDSLLERLSIRSMILLLKIEGNCSHLRAKPAHMVGHLPGGPENLTLNQVAETFERVSGRQVQKRHIPLQMMRVMSILMRPINPALSRQIRSGIYMDTANLHYDMTETARAFGIQLTSLEEIARRATTSAARLETLRVP
ncbi:MAG TPA: hypothetical protein VFQ30_06970, partial [Ktedonobacteraceae bacterium]|nr:hypothetical protein [Ktedonobacteraceae bacterium]